MATRAVLALWLAASACGRIDFSTARGTADGGAGDGRPADVQNVCPGFDARPDLNMNGVADCLENMIAYGQFTTGVAPFADSTSATIAWSATDAMGSATSGSALLTDTVQTTTANGGDVLSDCIAVQPNMTYTVYAQYFMASGQPGGDASNAAWIPIQVWGDTACTMPGATISGGTLGATKDAWDVYQRTFTPSGRAIQLMVGVIKGPTTSPVAAAFDNLLLVAN
ncbi:MAG: hypothetical protein ACM31C_05445 [Acidobacteriota bacterium]